MWTMFSIFDGANECKMLVFISLLLAFITIGIFSIFHCGNFRSLRWKVDDIERASHLDWPNSWSTAFRSICVRKPESCCDFPRKKKRSIIFVAVPPGEMPTHCSIQHKPPHTLRRSGVNVFHRLLLFHACCCLANCRVFVYHVKHSCYENVFSTPPNEQREENRKKILKTTSERLKLRFLQEWLSMWCMTIWCMICARRDWEIYEKTFNDAHRETCSTSDIHIQVQWFLATCDKTNVLFITSSAFRNVYLSRKMLVMFSQRHSSSAQGHCRCFFR